jgi:hypothetical protein
MELAYYRGDIFLISFSILLSMFDVGDVVVYKIKDQEIPIDHSVI